MDVLMKILSIFASLLLMAFPFLMELFTFLRDKNRKISYKRFWLMLFALVYMIGATVVLRLVADFVLGLENAGPIQWLVAQLPPSDRVVYVAKVLVAVVTNAAIGFVYWLLSKAFRMKIESKDLLNPEGKDGQYTWLQKIERKVILFFHTETWFFVGNILKYFNAILSAAYCLIFVAYQLPVYFDGQWIPYDLITNVFSAGYQYPTITLLVLWQIYFFLEGIRKLEEQCPELIGLKVQRTIRSEVDLKAIDDAVRKQFKDHYVCDLDLSERVQRTVASHSHHEITKFIGRAVENDRRNIHSSKEIYLDCLDELLERDKNVVVNGSLFSEFSVYFLRYLAVILARGDHAVFVCNNETQTDAVYQYLKEGLSQLSSLYMDLAGRDTVDMDDPIWRIVKINGQQDVLEEATVDENSILVTTLNYLCSSHFESQHKKFIHLIDTIVFVDALKTVNSYNRLMVMLNTRFRHITKSNALQAKNGTLNENFRARYMSKPVHYICFNDSRVAGLDKVLGNLLAAEFKTVDAMNYSPGTIVRCYNYESCVNEEGRRVSPQRIKSDEELGPLMNMAILCLENGAGEVTVFADDIIPYADLQESMMANRGQLKIKVDENKIRINSPYYNPNDYSVLIAMDSGDNLPAALRRYMSMLSEKPALVILFSRPYMLRDYYYGNIQALWEYRQVERIPVEESTKREIAQRIMVKANAGGISEEEILRIVDDAYAREQLVDVPHIEEYLQKKDHNAILIAMAGILGVQIRNKLQLFQYFEYSSYRDFNEKGLYHSENKILLRRQGELFDMINGRDMVVMCVNDQRITLPIPKDRLTQNYIVGQNLLHEGKIYYIHKIDTAEGRIYAKLAVGGLNNEAYQYLQMREYHLEMKPEQVQIAFPTKQMVPAEQGDAVCVREAYASAFRVPMEVWTRGYYTVDPHTLSRSSAGSDFYSICRADNDVLAKQTYRRYGQMEAPQYSSEMIMKSTQLVAKPKGALVMSLRLCGQFGPDCNKTMLLASTMLNELLRTMFPSVADSVAVCPVLHGQITDPEMNAMLDRQPKLRITGRPEREEQDFELLIIEDCQSDLGVVSVLMSDGGNVLKTLFQPLMAYLKWYAEDKNKSRYLYCGLDKEPTCFDFESLYQLAQLLGDDNHDPEYEEIQQVVEYESCDFCGKRYAENEGIIQLDDGRKMCRSCAEKLVGNNKKELKLHLDRAKLYMESTYGITLGDDYEICFESTVKIVNTLKQNRDYARRGTDMPLRSYVDEKKKVYVEYDLPSVNLSELLVRELTHVWQLKHLPDLTQSLSEGHIALVGIQYLRFMNRDALADIRTAYYESTANVSGEGYRELVQALLTNPQSHNNPFVYLLGNGSEENVPITKTPAVELAGTMGLPYTPEQPDRALDGQLKYYYYSRLSAVEQRAYDTLLTAARNHQEQIVVEFGTDVMRKISYMVLYDHPELFWYNGLMSDGQKYSLRYGATAEEAASLQKQIDEVVPQYLEGIDDSMSAYDVALRLYVKLISTVDYDGIALNKEQEAGGPDRSKIDYLRTICGVFLNESAVCEGYTRAMQYLLQKCGVESAEVVGDILKENGEHGGGHAWNVLKLDGDYYYLDVTWDDGSNTIQTVRNDRFGLRYFGITSEELTRTRDFTDNPLPMPVFSATRANYYYHNGLVLETYDLSLLKPMAQAAAKSELGFVTFKCKSREVYDTAMDNLFITGNDYLEVLKAAAKVDRKIRSACTYSCDKYMQSINIYFQYK